MSLLFSGPVAMIQKTDDRHNLPARIANRYPANSPPKARIIAKLFPNIRRSAAFAKDG